MKMASSRDSESLRGHPDAVDAPRRLTIEPQNIEELTELRDYKSQVPEKLIALKKVIEEAMRNYQVCDELCYKLPEADFTLRWDLYAWPKKITDECMALEEKCIRLENKQQVEMEEAQAEFAETLKYYQSEVDALSQFHDLKLVDSIALKVSTIKGNLAKADDDARLYNARESLFGKPVTDYALLKDIVKKFEAEWNGVGGEIVRRIPKSRGPKSFHRYSSAPPIDGYGFRGQSPLVLYLSPFEFFMYWDIQRVPDPFRRDCNGRSVWTEEGEEYYENHKNEYGFRLLPGKHYKVSIEKM